MNIFIKKEYIVPWHIFWTNVLLGHSSKVFVEYNLLIIHSSLNWNCSFIKLSSWVSDCLIFFIPVSECSAQNRMQESNLLSFDMWSSNQFWTDWDNDLILDRVLLIANSFMSFFILIITIAKFLLWYWPRFFMGAKFHGVAKSQTRLRG